MGSVRRLQRRQKKHGFACRCCGPDSDSAAGRWMALWLDNVHVGVRLRPGSRSRAAVERDATRAVHESGLEVCEAGHRVEIVHGDGCLMAEGAEVCACGPDIFATGTFAELAHTEGNA